MKEIVEAQTPWKWGQVLMMKGKAFSPSYYLGYCPHAQALQNKEGPLTLSFNLLTNELNPID
jgi:hypothetical protein